MCFSLMLLPGFTKNRSINACNCLIVRYSVLEVRRQYLVSVDIFILLLSKKLFNSYITLYELRLRL